MEGFADRIVSVVARSQTEVLDVVGNYWMGER
jgi:hypothetical protein